MRSSPHTFRHTFARGHLVNSGDVFSLRQILGHATLDMVRRYVSLSEADLVARHLAGSPADRLGKRAGRPVALVRGAAFACGERTIREVVMP